MPIPVTVGVDDAMKAKLTEYLGHLEASVKQGGDFVAEQVPDVLHQMVTYNLACSVFWFVFGLAIAVFGVRFARGLGRVLPVVDEDGFPVKAVVTTVLSLLALVVSFLFVASNVSTILKCWFAPKYFVLEQIVSMVR